MRVVVDTNVFISAALKDGSAPRNAFRWIERNCRVLKSAATEEELRQTLAKPKLARLLIQGNFIERLTKMAREAELVFVNEHIKASRDPDDDKFLELAVSGEADMIISGDTDLLELDPFRSIPILSPAEFMLGVTAITIGDRPAGHR